MKINFVRVVFFHMITFLFWAGLLLHYLLQNSPAGSGPGIVLTAFYVPNYNCCISPEFAGRPFLFYLYLLTFLCVLTSLFVSRYVFRSPLSLKEAFLIYGTVIFIAYGFLQLRQRAALLLREHHTLGSTDLDGKLSVLYGPDYRFAKRCSRYFPEGVSALLITDLDLSRDPGMYRHRVLSYFLYPIDIRNVRPGPPEAAVIYNRENSYQEVPEGHRILMDFNHGLGLLTVRQDREEK